VACRLRRHRCVLVLAVTGDTLAATFTLLRVCCRLFEPAMTLRPGNARPSAPPRA
jgi:hypothetical protein